MQHRKSLANPMSPGRPARNCKNAKPATTTRGPNLTLSGSGWWCEVSGDARVGAEIFFFFFGDSLPGSRAARGGWGAVGLSGCQLEDSARQLTDNSFGCHHIPVAILGNGSSCSCKARGGMALNVGIQPRVESHFKTRRCALFSGQRNRQPPAA